MKNTYYKIDKLSNHVIIDTGFPFKSEQFTSNQSDIPLVKGENLHQGYIDWNGSKYWNKDNTHDYSKYWLQTNDIVLAMDRPWIQAGLKWSCIKSHDPKALLVQRVARLRSKKTVHQKFLRCLIGSEYFSGYIQPIVTGVNVPHISAKQIGDCFVPVPPFLSQERIAAVISTYDDLIENNDRRITLLEKMAEEIYREWFVRLRFPGHEQAKFHKGIPEGWEMKPFSKMDGKGWSQRQLSYCVQFATTFPDQEILHTLCAELSWSHFKLVIAIEDPLKRDFYIEIARTDRWSVRQLQERINSMLYERTAISRQPAETIRHDLEQLRQTQQLSPNLLLKDPYILDFLNLNDRYLEKDLEDAILRDIEQFLLELGAGFTFVARQKRLQIDDDDYYIDLLFYNRQLQRLIAIDLKLGNFRPEYKGQMELYLRWLAKHDQQPHEQPPLGIIAQAKSKNRSNC
jgi:predicted nuclease of restriction endonuclease-like (RecB) superfamily